MLRTRKIGILLVLMLRSVLGVGYAQNCFGTLLFREDFGGNDPEAPRISTTPIIWMQNYTQLTTDRFGSMGGGRYLVTKSGYCNGDTVCAHNVWHSSQWHIMDDHTYPNDYSRGYFLEVDGKSGNHTFYKASVGGLCESSVLTFSVYAVNVITYNQYKAKREGFFFLPDLKFLITNPVTGETIGTYATGPIYYDTLTYQMPREKECMDGNQDWLYSANWNQYAFTMQLPAGVDSVSFSILNNANTTTGNDFALDDIEIWLCSPDVQIIPENDTVCSGSELSIRSEVSNNVSFTEPFDYLWEHSLDSMVWDTVSYEAVFTQPSAQLRDSGWYRLTISSAGSMATTLCRAYSEPIRLWTRGCQKDVSVTLYEGCDSVFYDGQWYQSSYVQRDTIARYLQGDSIHIDSIVVRPSSEHGITLPAVDSLRYNGVLFTYDTTIVEILTNHAGCDSVLTIRMNFTYLPTYDTTYLRACDSIWYEGKWYYQSFQKTSTISRVRAGNLIHTDIVEVGSATSFHIDVAGVDSVWMENGYVYRDTVVEWHLTNYSGCDSVVYFNVHLEYSNSGDASDGEMIEELILNKYDWIVLLNNRRLRELFPNQEVDSFTWLRDNEPQPWYKLDYYTEDRILDGSFQLLLTIGGKPIKSNIVVIHRETAEQNAPKILRNGTLYIHYNDAYYNAQGIRVQ